VVGLHDVGHSALAGLRVHPDDGLVCAPDILGVDRQIRHLPEDVLDIGVGLATLLEDPTASLTDPTVLSAGFDAFVRLFSNDLAPVRLVRDLGMAAVNRVPALRRAFMHEAGGATGDLPRLMQGRALP
jgi:hypothetical protein